MQLEHKKFFSPSMGTENVGPLLRSIIKMARPQTILEIGSGYTTPFILDAIEQYENVLNDGNLDLSYFQKPYKKPKFIIVDDDSIEDSSSYTVANEFREHELVEVISGKFQGLARKLNTKYGFFEFVWFDCGGEAEYTDFLEEYWDMCTNYVVFHFTYSNGKPNSIHRKIMQRCTSKTEVLTISEPHKYRQSSVTIVKKRDIQ